LFCQDTVSVAGSFHGYIDLSITSGWLHQPFHEW